MITIGIDALSLAVPAGYLELADLAEARDVPPGKFVEGLGVKRMAVAAAHEDPVALAANAALRLIEKSGRSPSEIGLCVVGTETAVDHSKPIAAYLHGLLGLPSRCRVYEAKHACFGGTAGLLTALDWIVAGRDVKGDRPRVALVVCTDVARYGLRTAGEPTQGAGAVAMIVSERPRLVEIDINVSGSFSRDVNDFWRPLDRKEAVVDGHHSVGCYLDALAGAFSAWRALDATHEPIARTCYHVPYGKMARKAHRHRLGLDGISEADADASFEREVAPSLVLPSLIGNVYTGSLYLALASLLHAESAELEGKRIGLFSYGSGCTAEFFSGRVAAGASELVTKLDLAGPLEGRRRLTVAEYERIREADNAVDRAPVGSLTSPASGVAFLGVDSERRMYSN